MSLTEEDGDIVLVLNECLKGAGSHVLNLVNTMIITDMTFRIDGFLLAYEKSASIQNNVSHSHCILFISGVYEQMTSLKGELLHSIFSALGLQGIKERFGRAS